MIALFVVIPILLGYVEDPPESGLLIPLLVLLLLALGLGTPIFAGLGGIAAVLLWHYYDPVSAIPLEAYNMSVKPSLPTIPLFTSRGTSSRRAVPRSTGRPVPRLFRLVARRPRRCGLRGLCFFHIVYRRQRRYHSGHGRVDVPHAHPGGLSRSVSTGLLTSAGSLGLLFPPSLAVILYAFVAEVDIRRLFVSGLVPGVLEIVLIAIFCLYFSRKASITTVPFEGKKAWRALWAAKWEVLIPVVVLGSILTGIATLVEAAAVTVLYAFVLEFIIHRDLSISKDLIRVAGNAAVLIGSVLIILGMALGLTNYFVIADIPGEAVAWVRGFVESPLFFLLLFNLFLLIVGCVMDIYSAIVVVVPLIAPLGHHFGIDPYHLGIIFLTNLELGYLTPPVGMNLFLASHRFRQPLPAVYRAALPFLGIRAVAVLLVTYVPFLTTFLPSLFQFD